jgi:hypothetical protein
MSGSAEWKPKLRCEIRRMRLLSPSRRPLFSPRRIAARMPARWRRIVRASLTNGSSFDLEAQASQASRCAGALAGAARSGDPAVGVPADRRGRRGNVYRCNSDGQRPLVLYHYARRIMPVAGPMIGSRRFAPAGMLYKPDSPSDAVARRAPRPGARVKWQVNATQISFRRCARPASARRWHTPSQTRLARPGLASNPSSSSGQSRTSTQQPQKSSDERTATSAPRQRRRQPRLASAKRRRAAQPQTRPPKPAQTQKPDKTSGGPVNRPRKQVSGRSLHRSRY